jgi:hypothetical protein
LSIERAGGGLGEFGSEIVMSETRTSEIVSDGVHSGVSADRHRAVRYILAYSISASVWSLNRVMTILSKSVDRSHDQFVAAWFSQL